jgi:hypothetical protein
MKITEDIRKMADQGELSELLAIEPAGREA